MRHRLLVLSLVALLLPCLVLAKDGKLRGKISDKETGGALIGANVTVKGTTLGAAADLNGDYIILRVAPGTYTVKASYIGYAPVAISNIKVSAGQTTTLDFKLPPAYVEVGEVNIIAESTLVQRNTPNAEHNAAMRRKVAQKAIINILPPKIKWLEPAGFTTTASNKTIALKAQITSDTKITEVRILHDGRPLATERAIRLGENLGFTKMLERQITLNTGKNEIAIIAANENGASEPALRIVNYSGAVPDWQKPNLYLLAIGISAYKLPDLQLQYADDDATAIASAFRRQQGKFYKQVAVKEVIDDAATRENILNSLDWLSRSATQKDVAMVFIASHGTNDATGNYYLVPADGDPQQLRSSSVSWRELDDVLSDLPSKVVLFLDTCHSGQFSKNIQVAMRDVDNTEAIRELSSEENGIVTVNATTGGQKSQEQGSWGHGAFTKALLEALENGKADYNGDGMIHLHELQNYLAERVKDLTGGLQHANVQIPSTIGRFPIFQWR